MVTLSAGESIDAAYRKFIKELVINGTFKEFEKARYHIGQGQLLSDQRRQFYKTKRKRAQARRKMKNKRH